MEKCFGVAPLVEINQSWVSLKYDCLLHNNLLKKKKSNRISTNSERNWQRV
jgi:hypothetical protein